MIVKICNDMAKDNPTVKVLFDGNLTSNDPAIIYLPDCGMANTIKTLSEALGARVINVNSKIALMKDHKTLISLSYR